MPVITWKPEFSVNVKAIDEQHQKLIGMINLLNSAMAEGKGRSVLGEIFNSLADYASVHFATEEDLMVRFAYPEYAEHKREHEKGVRKIAEFKSRFEKGETATSIDVISFLTSWLNTHILQSDKRYGPFFNEKGLV